MPVHNVPRGDDPAAALKDVVAVAEKAGETVVQVTEVGNNWVLVTRPAPRAPKHKTRVETRG